MDYKATAQSILKYVGGKSNIVHLEHCSTRLRFSLADNSKANMAALEKIEGVIAVKMTGQCQVVIGNDVLEVYDEVVKLIGGSFEGAGQKRKEKMKLGAFLIDFLIGIFQPLIFAVAGAGVLKSMLLLFKIAGILDASGQTFMILNYIADAPLYFLPVLVAATTANKLKVNYLVAMAAVSALILPNMTAAIGDGASLFGFGIRNITYSNQVFPAILTVIFYAQMERFFTKISPKPIRVFFVPMMSLLLTVPVALLILGPIGYTLGEGLTIVILAIFDKVGWIATALLAAILPFMVATGMHKAMIPYAVTTFTTYGKEVLYLPASLAHNIAESGASFGVALRTKDTNRRSIAISVGISALFGITEPALYGITLQNKKVLSSVVMGSFIGGAYIGITQVEAFALVGPGVASISMYISDTAPMNFINAIIGAIIAFGVSLVAAFIMGKDETKNESVSETEIVTNGYLTEDVDVMAPIEGKMIPLSKVNDEIFSNKIMGDGVAIIPEKGELYAPFTGEIAMVFDTHHALGMKAENGAEFLFHVGLDTVKLGGKYFEMHVKAGDRVKAGDLLLTFDLDAIVREGYDPVTILVSTNQSGYSVHVQNKEDVATKDLTMIVSPVMN